MQNRLDGMAIIPSNKSIGRQGGERKLDKQINLQHIEATEDRF